MSLIFREVTYMCTNAECGHTYVVNMEFARRVYGTSSIVRYVRVGCWDNVMKTAS